jgi:hypothetical protein
MPLIMRGHPMQISQYKNAYLLLSFGVQVYWPSDRLPEHPETTSLYIFAAEGTKIQMSKSVDKPLCFVDLLHFRVCKLDLSCLIAKHGHPPPENMKTKGGWTGIPFRSSLYIIRFI